MHSPARRSVWDSLPAEMKFTVVEHLDDHDIPKFSKLNRESYSLSIPSLYRVSSCLHQRIYQVIDLPMPQVVNLRGSKALRSFLDSVPSTHCRYVRVMNVDMSMDGLYSPLRATTSLMDLLDRCSRVEELSLSIPGSLRPSIIPYFERLHTLRKLSISNCGRDETSPL